MPDPSAAPAHALYVELATRITTQRLHYRSGDEETAATSVASLFKATRDLMTAHPAAHTFHHVALALINDTARPYTARWHGWMTQDGDKTDKDGKPILKLRDEWVRRKFREELRELQPRLFGFQKTLFAISRGEVPDSRWIAADLTREELAELTRECYATSRRASLGDDLPFALRPQVKLRAAAPSGRTDVEMAADIEHAEGAQVLRRRMALRSFASLDADPTAHSGVRNATGLALSGGGIRSATFCLGILQALHRRKMFVEIDYLSTVSGGGYLGSFMSCYLGAGALEEVEQRVEQTRGQPLEVPTAPTPSTPPVPLAPAGGEDDPTARLQETFEATDGGASESPAIRHLRNNSRYLLNGGTWGLLRIAAVFISGFFTSLLMLLTVPLVGAWAVRCAKSPRISQFFERHLWLLEPWRNWPFLVGTAVAVVGGLLLAIGSKKNRLSARIVMALGALASLVWALALVRWLGLALVYPPHLELSTAWRHPAGVALAGILALLAIFWLLTPFFQRMAHGTPWDSFWAKARSLVETDALLTTVAAGLTAALCVAFPFVRGYELARDRLGGLFDDRFGALLGWKPPELLATALFSLVPAIFGALTRRKDGSIRGWAQSLFHLTAPAFFLVAFLVFASRLGVGGREVQDFFWPLVVTGALLAWAFLFLNINTFALHRYYRDRLCECYLAMRGRQQRPWLKRFRDRLVHGARDTGATEECDGVGTLQRLPLSSLGVCPAAPYHLLNATLNAAASKSAGLRGRNGDFFLFSRHYCGSPLTGYLTTEDLEKVDPHIDLGTAMAISGAAASTNMGWQTVRRLRFLLTLFNVRLGYWMRRPGSRSFRWPSEGLWRPFEGPGPLYFLREMLGAVHETSRYVNLSDGGHIENLAVYELLRRQCKFVVCVDAGMEPGMECADLMRLQRYAAIDLGVRMHFDPADLTLLPTTYSRAYAVLVKIDYDPPSEPSGEAASKKLGWMLYLKLAITGTEPRYVLDYRRQNPAFPHQTTADQFYDEAQFEAYRALGECAAESLFREEVIGATTPEGISEWFQSLADNLLPDNDSAFPQR